MTTRETTERWSLFLWGAVFGAMVAMASSELVVRYRNHQRSEEKPIMRYILRYDGKSL